MVKECELRGLARSPDARRRVGRRARCRKKAARAGEAPPGSGMGCGERTGGWEEITPYVVGDEQGQVREEDRLNMTFGCA
jgi:hypothetical protein